jgi:hypothetical protein
VSDAGCTREPECAVSGHTAPTSMFPDPARRSPHSARVGAAFTIAAIAIVLLGCSPPRYGVPPTPQTTLAVLTVILAA